MCHCVGGGVSVGLGGCEASLYFPQFCCEPKIALKKIKPLKTKSVLVDESNFTELL